MKEITAANVATITTTTAAVAAPVMGIDPMLVIGAITGAGIFILSHEEQSALKKLILFLGSVACGFIGARVAGDIVAILMPGSIEISDGVGAIVASSVSVRILQRVLKIIDSPNPLQELLKGKRP